MPVIKPNYFQFPNEIVDHHLTSLSGPELKVLIWMFRQTRGWNRDSAVASLSNIEKALAMGHTSVCDSIRSLVDKGLLKRQKQVSPDGAFSSTRYEIDFAIEVVRQDGLPLSATADNPSPLERTTLVRQGVHVKEEIQQSSEHKSAEQVLLSSETLPEQTTDEPLADGVDLIRELRSVRGVKDPSPSERTTLKESAQRIGLTVAALQAELRDDPPESVAAFLERHGIGDRGRRQSTFKRPPTRPSSSNGQRGAFYETVVRVRDTQESLWRSDQGFKAFVHAYILTGADATDGDQAKAYPKWQAMSPEERALATERVATADPCYVKLIHNYLITEEYTRKPRPKPKANPNDQASMAARALAILEEKKKQEGRA